MIQEILKNAVILFFGFSALMVVVTAILWQWIRVEEGTKNLNFNWKGLFKIEVLILLISVVGGICSTPFFKKHALLTGFMFLSVYVVINGRPFIKGIKNIIKSIMKN